MFVNIVNFCESFKGARRMRCVHQPLTNGQARLNYTSFVCVRDGRWTMVGVECFACGDGKVGNVSTAAARRFCFVVSSSVGTDAYDCIGVSGPVSPTHRLIAMGYGNTTATMNYNTKIKKMFFISINEWINDENIKNLPFL